MGRRIVLVAVLSLVATGAMAGRVARDVKPVPTLGLRRFAQPRRMLIGAAADSAHLTSRVYAHDLAGEFNALSPENELKWLFTEPHPNVYNFGPGDRLVAFAQTHHMSVRGNTLVWDQENPTWLTSGHYGPARLRSFLDHHIAKEVGHYKGKVQQWDVVNEAFNDDGSLRADVWSHALGASYIDEAFRDAHAADPEAELFYNDYSLEFPGPKANRVFAMVRKMKADGVPIDAVGFQMHATERFPTAAQLARQMARYASIGIPVAVTEMDVRLAEPPSAHDLQIQASDYHDALAACLHASNCKTFVMWGFTDRYSWIPSYFPGYGSALIFNANYAKKPAYDGLEKAFEGR